MNDHNRRILIASPDYPPDSGGISMAAFELTRGLTSLGYEVKVLAQATECFEKQDIGKAFDVIRLNHDDYRRAFKPEAMKLVTEFRPACVIINGYNKQFTQNCALFFLEEFKIPLIYRPHGVATSLPDFFRWNKPPFFGVKRWIQSFFLIRSWTRTCTLFSQIVFLSSQQGIFKNYDRRLASKWKLGNTSDIPNTFPTVELDKTSFREKYKLNGVLYTYIAGFSPRKNQIRAIRALKRCRISDVSFVFIGPERNQYAEKSEKAAGKDPRFVFLYNLPRQDVIEAQNATDCCFLYSTSEQQPLVLLEAMSCHKPWICPDVGSVGEMKGGIVLKNRSPKHLLDALETMQNPLTRKRYGDEGFEQWRDSYSPEIVYARWDRLLDDIIVKKTVGSGY